jgi:hypothetical protein
MLSPMRAGVVLVALALVLAAAPSAALASAPHWSMMKVLARLDGARIHVGSRTLRIDSDTTLCAGKGPAIRRDGVRKWRGFLCTYTTFTKSGADRDIDFRVRVLGRLRYQIYDAHWVRGIR